MKIVLVGGGTGGHFYPMVAVARELFEIKTQERLIDLRIIYISDKLLDEQAFIDEQIKFESIRSGKWRRYFALRNFTDIFLTLVGILQSIWKFMIDPPDVVFSSGGYSAFPPLIAARLFRIPVLIYDADSVPGWVSRWSGKFAKRVAINYEGAARFFPADLVAQIGHPIRKRLLGGRVEDAESHFQLEKNIPVITILGGSQGAEAVNEVVIAALSRLLAKWQVIHQTGEKNFDEVRGVVNVVFEKSSKEIRRRYHPVSYFNEGELRKVGIVSSVIVARAGAGSIAEIAAWRIPAILIPLPESAADHQQTNALIYAGMGAAEVIEQGNLTPNLLISRIEHILSDATTRERMQKAAQSFTKPDAARRIAEELIRLGTHD